MSRRRHRQPNRVRGARLPPRGWRFCRNPSPVCARPLPSVAAAAMGRRGPARAGLRVGWRR
eukprot:9575625-Lingulodinium_polyedra.AAC.1